MSEIGEGIGSAIEGALAGQAAESEQGSLHPGKNAEHGPSACLNCGTATIGPHCHQCGQKRHVHRSLAAIGHDIMHGVLHLDGKLWRTLPLLTLKPGKITRRYIDGERAKFVSPMGMFLFTVFLMFGVFQVLGITPPTDIDAPDVDSTIEDIRANAQQEQDAAKAQLASLPEDSPERSALEKTIAETQDALDGVDGVERLQINENTGISFTGTGIKSFDEGLVKKWRENPGLMLYKLQNNAYKFSWLLIPLSIPFVWLLFAWKRRFKAYDHAIFVTYSLGFMSLLFVTLSVLGAIGVPIGALVAVGAVAPPIHLYKQLRHGYDLSRRGALWRLFALSVFIWVVIILFLWALVLIGAF